VLPRPALWAARGAMPRGALRAAGRGAAGSQPLYGPVGPPILPSTVTEVAMFALPTV
jgi:hypothetical protein